MADVTRKTVVAKALGLEDVWTDEELEVLQKMKTALEKKSSKPKKDAEETERYKAEVLDYLADGEGHTATEVGTAVGITCQKATAILRKLIEDGAVEKTVGKGKTPTTFKAV